MHDITNSNGHEFEQTLGDGEGQGSLVCCSLWGRKELDMTGWSNLGPLLFEAFAFVKQKSEMALPCTLYYVRPLS